MRYSLFVLHFLFRNINVVKTRHLTWGKQSRGFDSEYPDIPSESVVLHCAEHCYHDPHGLPQHILSQNNRASQTDNSASKLVEQKATSFILYASAHARGRTSSFRADQSRNCWHHYSASFLSSSPPPSPCHSSASHIQAYISKMASRPPGLYVDHHSINEHLTRTVGATDSLKMQLWGWQNVRQPQLISFVYILYSVYTVIT